MARGLQICHCEEAIGRRGNLGKAPPDPYRPPLKRCWPPDLSLRGGRRPTWQSHATGHVFAGSTLLSNRVLRDSHVASLLGMTRLGGAVVHQCPLAVECSPTGRSPPVKGMPLPYKRHTLKFSAQNAPKLCRKISRRNPGGIFWNLQISLRAYKAEWPAGWYRLKPYNSGNASGCWQS